MKYLHAMEKVIARLEGWFIVLFLALMVVFTFVQVALRALYTHAHMNWANILMGHVDWTETLVRLLVLWITFLGASLLAGDNKHIKIDLMSNVLPNRWIPFLEVILSIALVCITALMTHASISYLKMEMDFGGNIFLHIPNWIGQLILPMGFFLLFFRFFIRGLTHVLNILRGGQT